MATLLLLACVGGYVDAVSYLGLGHVFTAAMTGNTVLLALAAAQQDWTAVAMGAQSATARKVDVAAVSTTYVTGTLTSLTAGTVEWLRATRQVRRRARHNPAETVQVVTEHGPALPAVAWLVYALGALIGGLIVMTATVLAFPLAALVIAILALIDWRADSGDLQVTSPLPTESSTSGSG